MTQPIRLFKIIETLFIGKKKQIPSYYFEGRRRRRTRGF